MANMSILMDVNDASAAAMEARSAARSCTTCSKAKAKCVRRSANVCERCARLKKECHLREPVLRRRKIVKTTRAAQLEKLETKIEHLVNALATTQAQRGYSTDLGQPSPPISLVSERSSSLQRQDEVLQSLCEYQEDGPQESPRSTTATPTSTSNTPNPAVMPNCTGLPNMTVEEATLRAQPAHFTAQPAHISCYESLGVSIPEAEVLLDRYRRLMSHAMPFVVLQPHATAQQLLTKKPLLLHAIVTITHFHDLPRQQLMVKQLIRDISERVLINNEKSVDVLQGILVFVAWYHPHMFWGQQVTNLLHLAMALVVDMGVDRSPQECRDFKATTAKAVHGPSLVGKLPTLEEHRSLAGTFYLTSMLAAAFKKLDPMPYTKYLEEALNTLEQSCEYESDLFLVQMVRLQHLVQEASETDAPTAPTQMYVKSFNADLANLRRNDPCKDSSNILLRMQYLTSEIHVRELSLVDIQENKAKPLRSHLDDLSQLIYAAKNFLDVYFTIPTRDYLTIPFSVFGQFAHAFIVLVKLASVEVEGWDVKSFNEQLQFSVVIEEAARRFDGSAKLAPDGLLSINNDSFTKWAHRIRWMKSMYEAKFVQEEAKGEDAARAVLGTWKPRDVDFPSAGAPQQQPTPPDDVLSGDFFNYLDESFWQSFAGDYELGFPEMAMT